MIPRLHIKQRVPNWNGRPIIVIRQHPGSMGERPRIKRQRYNCTPSGSKGNRSNTSLITCINWKPFKNQALFSSLKQTALLCFNSWWKRLILLYGLLKLTIFEGPVYFPNKAKVTPFTRVTEGESILQNFLTANLVRRSMHRQLYTLEVFTFPKKKEMAWLILVFAIRTSFTRSDCEVLNFQ